MFTFLKNDSSFAEIKVYLGIINSPIEFLKV